MKRKNYIVFVKIEASHYFEAENKKDAKRIIKDIYEQDYNIKLDDSEIIEIKEDK